MTEETKKKTDTLRKRKQDDDGWGGQGCRGYMKEKERKLEEQFLSLNEKDGNPLKSYIFDGVCIFVNGYTNPSSDHLKQIMAEHGGHYQHYYSRRSCTHIIATNLPDSKVRELKNEKIVHPDWIIESVKAGKQLPIHKYRLYCTAQGKSTDVFATFARKSKLEEKSCQDSAEKRQKSEEISRQTFDAAENKNTHSAIKEPGQEERNTGFGTCVSSEDLPDYLEDDSIVAMFGEGESDSEELSRCLSLQPGDWLKNKLTGRETLVLAEEEKVHVEETPLADEACSKQEQNLSSCKQRDEESCVGGTKQTHVTSPSQGEGEQSYQALRTEASSFEQMENIFVDKQRDDDSSIGVKFQAHVTSPSQGEGKQAYQAPRTETSSSEQMENISVDKQRNNDSSIGGKVQSHVTIPSLTKHNYRDVSPSKTMGKAGDPGFMAEFYSNSRLHHLSMWKSELKRFASMIHKISANKKAQKKMMKSHGGRCVMHIDLDSFFVSVSLKERPELKGKPVAVCHASKGTTSSMNMNSMSEIASCSYEARDKGVRNGMFLGNARSKCPELICVPYQFESYRTVSQKFYEILASYTSEIEAVSCDEALLDVTDLLSQTITSLDLASRMRADIYKETGCKASAGIASNILLARMATRKAKPDGQFHLQSKDVKEFMGSQKVPDLPGVGYSMRSKLQGMGVTTCGDLRLVPLQKLQETFGPKTGQSLYNNCRGIDDREIRTDHQRQSVSAEINYAIRFVEQQESHDFLHELAKEVHNRLKAIDMKGSQITLKLMIRKKGAPESAKHMGHGICDNISKSATVPQPTDDAKVIAKESVSLLQQLKVMASDIRGVGIQVTKLVDSTAKSKSNNTINFGTFTKSKSAVHLPENSANAVALDNNTDQSSETARQSATRQSSVTTVTSEVTTCRTFTTLSTTTITHPIAITKRPAIATAKSSRKFSPKKGTGKSKRVNKTATNTLKNFVTRMPNTEANKVHFQKPDEVEDPPLPSLFTSPDKIITPQQSLGFELPPISEIDPAVFYELPEDVQRSITAAYKQNNQALYIEPFRPTSGLGLFEGDASSRLLSTNDWRFSNMLHDKERDHVATHTAVKETDSGTETKSLRQYPETHANISTFDDRHRNQSVPNLLDAVGGKEVRHFVAQTAFPEIEKQCLGDESAYPKRLMEAKETGGTEIDILSGEVEVAESIVHKHDELSCQNVNVRSSVNASSRHETNDSDGSAVPGGHILSMSQLDPEVMSALPEELRREILRSIKFEERRQKRIKEKPVDFMIDKSTTNSNPSNSSGSSSSVKDYKEKFAPEQASILPLREVNGCNEKIHEVTDAGLEQESLREETFLPSDDVRLCGETSHQNVKEIVKAWIRSTNDPHLEDVDEFTNYLEDLLTKHNLEQAFLLMKLVQRLSKKSAEWTQSFDVINTRIQELSINIYGGRLSL
eukprot:Seg179.3 transcript_id=Seg179.3/GoldUCD/mRNA.D3Y31 product="DNA repair protein REV1" protein_id=Seg179.3/GoldUCD/D3Y31